MVKKLIRGLIAFTLLAVVFVVGDASPSSAIGPLRCTANGTVVTVLDPVTQVATWAVKGRGSCVGDDQGTHFLDFTGSGTSKGLGVCGKSGVVQDLSIAVTGTLESAVSGITTPLVQTWASPATTFPVSVPFLISGTSGVGVMWNHIFAQCPPGGTPAAYFDFDYFK